MKKSIVILLAINLSTLLGQSAGNSGLSFLKIGFGARNIAMGDLGVVTASDVTALNYNPALLAGYESSQILLTHNEWIQDVRSELLGVSFTAFDIPFAVGINTTSISDIEVRTRPGDPQSTFNAHYFFGSLSTGFRLFDRLSAGATVKYLYEGIFSDESNGWALDLGLHYEDLIENMNVGASIRNLGSMNELRNESTKLPADLRLGASYGFDLSQINSRILALGGFQKYLDTDDNHFHFGAEIFYNRVIALRAGYMTGYESKNITAGVGIVWNSINFDYAFVPFSYGLGSAHTISVKYTF